MRSLSSRTAVPLVGHHARVRKIGWFWFEVFGCPRAVPLPRFSVAARAILAVDLLPVGDGLRSGRSRIGAVVFIARRFPVGFTRDRGRGQSDDRLRLERGRGNQREGNLPEAQDKGGEGLQVVLPHVLVRRHGRIGSDGLRIPEMLQPLGVRALFSGKGQLGSHLATHSTNAVAANTPLFLEQGLSSGQQWSPDLSRVPRQVAGPAGGLDELSRKNGPFPLRKVGDPAVREDGSFSFQYPLMGRPDLRGAAVSAVAKGAAESLEGVGRDLRVGPQGLGGIHKPRVLDGPVAHDAAVHPGPFRDADLGELVSDVFGRAALVGVFGLGDQEIAVLILVLLPLAVGVLPEREKEECQCDQAHQGEQAIGAQHQNPPTSDGRSSRDRFTAMARSIPSLAPGSRCRSP